MARVPLTEEQVTEDFVVFNFEKVGLSDEQFIEFCADNRDFRFELTARKELVNVYIYRPGEPVQCLANPTTVSGEPVLPGFVFQISEIW